MSPARRWLESLVWAFLTTGVFFLVVRWGMWWWLGSTYLMVGAYTLLFWRTLAWCYAVSRPMPTVWRRQVPQQPRLIRRVILEEEVPWERS